MRDLVTWTFNGGERKEKVEGCRFKVGIGYRGKNFFFLFVWRCTL